MKLSEWQGSSGKWYVACTEDLGNSSGTWWYPARKLNMDLTAYIQLLIDYGATINYSEESKFLFFFWSEYNKAHKFLLDMNRKLRSVK